MATAGLPVDQELKKAFQELQGKLIGTKQQLRVNEGQIGGLRKKNQHGEIVKHELSSLSDQTPTYQSVGRMFVLTPKRDLLKSLDSDRKATEQKIKTIQTQNQYLEKSMKDAENNLRELITSKQKR